MRPAIAFIDGENLLFRYQAMLADGRRPRPEVTHRPNAFVWSSRIFSYTSFEFLRATYYTAVVGDDSYVLDLASAIQSTTFAKNGGRGALHASVFKKDARSQKTRSVDINITIDALRHTHRDHADEFFVVTGDGDFVPLVETVMREGKYVHVLALSSGLSPRLQTVGDNFWLLDEHFFEEP